MVSDTSTQGGHHSIASKRKAANGQESGVPWPPQSKRQKQGTNKAAIVEAANSLSADEFFSRFIPADARPQVSQLNFEVLPNLTLYVQNATGVHGLYLDECFRLVEETSAEDYNRSETRWSASKKRREMVLPDMKYIILREDEKPDVAGFVSFMITYEDGHEVVYIYEIHFVQRWQGKGLGQKLMCMVETIGKNVGVGKAMLTVFKVNARAVKWYQGLGYAVDEFSPQPRKLRNGTIKAPSYLILSKELHQDETAR